MEDFIVEEMNRIVDDYFHVTDLNELLKVCIQEKVMEKSIWSDITISCHLMLGGSSPSINRIAANMELIILALDMIDDLQDRDNPDKPWMTCPHEFTLNAIIAFLMASVSELSKISELNRDIMNPLMGEISHLITTSINGQQRDLNDSIVSEADYITMIQEKSGSLMRLACYLGYAGVGTFSDETLELLNELAKDIGVIAQIENDLKDLLRFDLKNDLLNKKRTLPIFYMLAIDEEEFLVIKQYYEGVLSRDELLKLKRECMQYFQDSGCIEYSRIIQTLYINHAEEIFNSLETFAPWNERFKEITFGR